MIERSFSRRQFIGASALGAIAGASVLTNPARAAADICLFAPDEKWTYDARAGFSKSGNSPWHGQTFTGRVKTTVVDGRVIFDGKKIA